MKFKLIIFSILICSGYLNAINFTFISPGDSILLITGKFYGENVRVLQQKHVIKEVVLNGKKLKINDSLFKQNVVIIDLKGQNLLKAQDVRLEIKYDYIGIKPLNMTKNALQESATMLNKKLPILIKPNLKGDTINTSFFKGKVVVMNAWFVGCKPCALEMPDLNNLVKKYSGKNVVFIAPCLSDTGKINNFLLTHEFKYDIIPNCSEYCKLLQCESYPTNCVIDKNGKIVLFNSGFKENTVDELTEYIDKALKEM